MDIDRATSGSTGPDPDRDPRRSHHPDPTPTTLADQTPQDRRSLAGIVAASAIGVVVVLGAYLLAATYQWQHGFVELTLQQVDGVVAPLTPSGIPLEATGDLVARASAEDLPTGAVVLLWGADALQALAWCAVILMLGLLARSLAVGRIFAPATLRLVTWFVVAVFLVVIGPYVLRHLGTNWAISTLGWEGRTAPSPGSGTAVWIGYLAMLFCVCVQIALRSGARLARDQDGLV